MRTLFALAMIAVLGGFGVAFASDHGRSDERAAQGRSLSADDMKAKADKMGYDVEHLKKDDEHYHARLIDRESGAGVTAAFDKETGELINARTGARRPGGRRAQGIARARQFARAPRRPSQVGEHREQDRD